MRAFCGQNIKCYVAYMNAKRNKSISKHVRYERKVSDKTKRSPTQVKDARSVKLKVI